MGSEYFKQPAKRLDREFRAMGARRGDRTPNANTYMFPDGAVLFVPRNVGPGGARAMLQRAREKYGSSPLDPLSMAVHRPGAPTIDLNRMIATQHAMERFDLMRAQANLTYTELLEALRIPERVLWSERHGRWLWVRGRIAVVAGVHDGNTTVVTILWTTQDLWDSNPRPKE